MCLIYINIGIKNVVFANFFSEKFWRFGKSVYLCTRKSGTPPDEQARKSSLKELHRQKQVVQEAAALRFPFGLAVPSGNKTDRQDDKVFLELGMKDIVLNRVRFLPCALWHGVRRQRYRFFTMKSLILAQDER